MPYSSSEEATAALSEQLDKIKQIADDTLAANGSEDTVSCEICEMTFDRRIYNDFAVPAGNYTALRIKIGSGEGHNWWCVMYPPLCLPGAENALQKYGENAKFVTGDEFEIRFAFLEWLESLKNTAKR